MEVHRQTVQSVVFDRDYPSAAPPVDLSDLLRDRNQRSCPDPRRYRYGGGLLGHARQAQAANESG